jgi:quercetin dioxygenase-like cupin family protein
MRKGWISLALLFMVLLVWVTAGSAAEHKKMAPSTTSIIVTPDEIRWKEGPPTLPLAKMAILDGDPHKRGFFTMRLKLPVGTKIPPHVHDNVERVTVISGKFNLAMGDKPENPKVLPAGSYFSLPPKTVHNAWVDEETIVQITSMGPWTYTPWTEKSAKKAAATK